MDPSGFKKPAKPDLLIRFVGPGIKPWTVPMRSLARVLEAVQRLVDQREESDDDKGKQDQRSESERQSLRTMRLLSLMSKSAGYAVAAPEPIPSLRLIRETGEGIEAPSSKAWTQPTLSSLRDLSDVARSLGMHIEIWDWGNGALKGDILATIGPNTYDNVAASAYINGHTSVYARIERVGGATEMHCGIRVAGQGGRMVICRVESVDLVRELGPYIYQNVYLSGMGTWLSHDFQLVRLSISAFEPPKRGSVRDTLRRMRDAGGSAWDSIPDPDAFIAEMRRS